MNRRLPPFVRRLVLGGALLAATLLAWLPQPPSVRAAEHVARPVLLAQADTKAAAETAREAAREASEIAREAAREASEAAREAAAAAKAAAREARRKATEADVADDAAKDDRHKGITIGISGTDREYDSFDQFLDRDPWLATMVIGIVFVVFLTPILLVALVVWYKVRKTRLQNETMVKLAERGALPPAEAMQAVVGGRADTAIAASAAPLAEQARTLRRAAAWSDLRKGVLMGAIGLATTFYSMLDDGTANWLGLALLFVGIGYCALWYFEDRQATAGRAAAPAPAPGSGPGDGQN
ncbi:MAG: hypothetical protein IT517_02180 [Burkholderiales bacterium]|nr:hypothetical protein [Burkholderiales bacterium]